jgi:hypothetical protein
MATQTRFIAAYDTERDTNRDNCLRALGPIRAAHERAKNGRIPATFFIVGKLLDKYPHEFCTALDVPEFEIGTHSFSHKVLRPHPFAHADEVFTDYETHCTEIYAGQILVQETFDRPCIGYRTAYGFDEKGGLQGDAGLLSIIANCGLKYVSSLLWGPDFSLPAELRAPFNYGFPNLWEMPGHGWHENVLKGNSIIYKGPARLIGFPQPYPELVPLKPIQTPEEEFELYALYIARARKLGLPYVSFIWHPWSLYRFDPEMRMLDMLFDYVQQIGMEPSTFEQEYLRLVGTS